MAVQVRTCRVGVQSLRMSIRVSCLWIPHKNAICGKIYQLMFLLVVRSIVCSTYLYREVDVSARQLACHRKYQGIRP